MDGYTRIFEEKGCTLLEEIRGEDKRVAFRCKCGKEPCFTYPQHVARKSWVGCSTCIKRAPKLRVVEYYRSLRKSQAQE